VTFLKILHLDGDYGFIDLMQVIELSIS